MNNYKYIINQMKIIGPCRNQIEIQFNDLEMLLPENHPARGIWQFVENMDTRPCFDYVHTFVGCDGRPTTSPKILLAVWIYSILDGNCSSRKLEMLCKNHNVYKWIVGGAPINRTMLADFRSKDIGKFEDLLTNCLAVMVKTGLISDRDFAQDGTRIKANAGVKSFKTEESLIKLRETIKSYIKDVINEEPATSYEQRVKERQVRIEKERLRRVEEALKMLEKERIIKEENGIKNNKPPSEEDLKKVKASFTDPCARKMKMGDGGFRMAYNVQFATGMDSRVIFGVDVVSTLDPGTAVPMMAKVHSKLKKLGMAAVRHWIGDGAYSGKEDVNLAAELFPNCKYYAPPQGYKNQSEAKKHRRNDSEAVKKWRDMIDSPEIEEIYKRRSSTAEFSNAQVKNFGFKQFLVRGLVKAKGQAFLHAIAQNISRYFDLMDKKQTEATI